MVAARDDRALADACLELAGSREWAAILGSAARQTILEHFSDQRSGDTLLGVYRSLAESDRGGTRVNGRELGTSRLAWALATGLFRIAGRRTFRAIHSRRVCREMHRVRRHPSSLRRAIQSARKILVVCHGNIIRSAFAGELLKRQTAGAGVQIRSAGLAAVAGNPAHPAAVRIAASHDVDLGGHAASPVDAESVAESDVVFVMDVSLLVTMRRRFPEARQKTFLMSCLAGDTPLEIRDPVDGDDSRFQACFDHISQAVRPIVGALHAVAIIQ